MLLCAWHSPPATPAFSGREVDLWRAGLDLPSGLLAELTAILSPDERARASRFHFARDRERFIACRGQLRVVLGRYLRVGPERVAFAYSRHGKPALAAPFAGTRLTFNVSHSQAVALFAVALGRRVGVDVEELHPVPGMDEIAAHYFSHEEALALSGEAPCDRTAAFFRVWTCKEAYLKATGQGLSGSLSEVEVTMTHSTSPRLISPPTGETAEFPWSLIVLTPAPGSVAALAVEGDVSELRTYTSPCGW